MKRIIVLITILMIVSLPTGGITSADMLIPSQPMSTYSPASGIPMEPVLSEHGITTGVDDVFTYTTQIGEQNTWDGNKWVRYIYTEGYDYWANETVSPENDTIILVHHHRNPSVQIGDLIFTHKDGGEIGVEYIKGGFAIDRLKWYAQYYFNDAWQNFTFDNYAFDGVDKTEDSVTAYQRWWSTNGELNVSYTYSYQSFLKMRAQATNLADVSVPVRIIWAALGIQVSGVDYSLIWDEDVKIGVDIGNAQQLFWHDVIQNTPEIAINTVVDKPNRRAAVVFGNMSSTLAQYETMDIDPTYTVAADAWDDQWDRTGGTWTHRTAYNDNAIVAASTSFYAQMGFQLAIPQYANIISAELWAYSKGGGGTQTVTVHRLVDATENLGPLESDTTGTRPATDTSPADVESYTITAGWYTHDTNIDSMLQEQVNKAGWVYGYSMGFRASGSSSNPAYWEDFQHADEHHSYLIATWEFPVTPPENYEPTLDNPDDTDYMYAQYKQYQITQSVKSDPRGDDGWLSGFTYRKYHRIIGATGAGTDYPMEFDVNYGAGTSFGSSVYLNSLCQTDFGDINFTDSDGETPLDYWMEEKTDSDDATFWVEVQDSLESGTAEIFIYWGTVGTTTTSSSGDATFLFYEDWTDENEDQWTKWNDEAGGGISWSATGATHGTIAKVEGGAGNYNDEWRSTAETTVGFSLLFRAKLEDPVAAYQGMRIGTGSAQEYAIAYLQIYANVYDRFSVYDDDGITDLIAIGTTHWDAYHLFEITRHREGTTTKLYVDGVLDETGNMATDENEVSYASFGVSDSEKDLYIDWFAARKFISTEPSHGVWGEQDKDGFNDIDYIELGLWNDARDTEYWTVRYDEDTNTFSEEPASDIIALDTGSSSATESGIWLNVTYYITIDWDHTDVTDTDVKCYAIDTLGEDDTDWYEVNWNVETRLDISDWWSATDSYGTHNRSTDDDTTVHHNGTIIYYGSSLHPQSAAVDSWAYKDSTPAIYASDLTLVDGYYESSGYVAWNSMTFGLHTMRTIIVPEGEGLVEASDLLHATHTSSFIIDRLKLKSYTLTNWYSPLISGFTGAMVGVDTPALTKYEVVYDYDETPVPSGGDLVIEVGALFLDYLAELTYNSTDELWYSMKEYSTTQYVFYQNWKVTGRGSLHGISGRDKVAWDISTHLVLWNRINVTVSIDYTLLPVNRTATLSSTAVWEFNGTTVAGYTCEYNVSSPITHSTTGVRYFTMESVYDTWSGITSFDANVVSCSWEMIDITSGPTYYWMQYSEEQVWLMWGIASTYKWNVTDVAVEYSHAVMLESSVNGTSNAKAYIFDGMIGGLAIGSFDPTWWCADIYVWAVSGDYNQTLWHMTLKVDILHSIHFTVFGIGETDSYVIFEYYTTHENATWVSVWDNMTGTPDLVYNHTSKGSHRIPLDPDIGTHELIFLFNQSMYLSWGEQTCDPSLTDDWWTWNTYNYIVSGSSYNAKIVLINSLYEFIPFETFEVYVNESRIYQEFYPVVEGNTYTVMVKNRYGDTVNSTSFEPSLELVVICNIYSLKFMSWFDGFCEVNISRSGISYTEVVMPLEIVNFKLYSAQYIYVIDYLNGTVSADYNINLTNSTGVIITGSTIADIMSMSEELWDLVFEVNVTITATNNYVLTISVDLDNINTTINSQIIQVLLDITNTNSTIYDQTVDLLALLQNTNSTLYSQTVDILVELNYISSNVTANYISVSAVLSAIDSNLYSNFTSISASLLLIDSNLMSNFTSIIADLTAIGSEITSNYISLTATLLAMDSSLLSNFTSISASLLLIDSSLMSNFTSLTSTLTAIGSNITAQTITLLAELNFISSNITASTVTLLASIANVNSTIYNQTVTILTRILNINSTIYAQGVDILTYIYNTNSTLYSQTIRMLLEIDEVEDLAESIKGLSETISGEVADQPTPIDMSEIFSVMLAAVLVFTLVIIIVWGLRAILRDKKEGKITKASNLDKDIDLSDDIEYQ